MKPIFACVIFVAFVAQLQAAPSSDPYNTEEGLKKLAENLDHLTKELEKATGVHTDFDKEKFLKAGKVLVEKLTEAGNKLKEALDSNFKNFPQGEEAKKKFEELLKQLNESVKNLSTPEVQKSAEKFRETAVASIKKVNEAAADLASKFGLKPPASIQKTLDEIIEETSKSFKVYQEKIVKLIDDAQNELKKKKA